MRIIDEALLREMRVTAPGCERCYRDRRQAGALTIHHLRCRGIGGASRLDIRINLVVLCWPCHAEIQGQKLAGIKLRQTVAEREGTTPEEIMDAVAAILRHPKDRPLPEELRRFVQ